MHPNAAMRQLLGLLRMWAPGTIERECAVCGHRVTRTYLERAICAALETLEQAGTTLPPDEQPTKPGRR